LGITRIASEQKMIPADEEAAGWPPYNCFYAAVPLTSYGIPEYGRLERLQFTTFDYHCVELVSVPNPDNVGTVPSGEPDAGNKYYCWMIIDVK